MVVKYPFTTTFLISASFSFLISCTTLSLSLTTRTFNFDSTSGLTDSTDSYARTTSETHEGARDATPRYSIWSSTEDTVYKNVSRINPRASPKPSTLLRDEVYVNRDRINNPENLFLRVHERWWTLTNVVLASLLLRTMTGWPNRDGRNKRSQET